MRLLQRVVAAAVILCAHASAQCLDWRAFPGSAFGPPGEVWASTVYDDGNGPSLLVGGSFTVPGVGTIGLMRFDGEQFVPFAPGLAGKVLAFAVHDFGSGPRLFAASHCIGGTFSQGCIAWWDGASWTPIATVAAIDNPSERIVAALLPFDDGSGTALYACGTFGTLNGTTVKGVARWTGGAWTQVGGGLHVSSGQVVPVRALAACDLGSGPNLYAAGWFTHSGATIVPAIARWDGTAWSAVGPATFLQAHSMAAFDDGAGVRLFVGGTHTSSNLVRQVQAWDGSAWSGPVGGSPPCLPRTMATFDAGGGASIHIGGTVLGDGDHAGVWRLASGAWTAIDQLFAKVTAATSDFPEVRLLQALDVGSGPELHVAGDFNAVGTRAALNHVRLESGTWSTLLPAGEGVGGTVRSLATFDDGAGPVLFVGGRFSDAGGAAGLGLARWDGSSWSIPGGGITPDGYTQSSETTSVNALCTGNLGDGAALYAAVGDARLFRWRAGTLSHVASSGGQYDACYALAIYDGGTGPQLYVGGRFAGYAGASTQHVARWTPAGGGATVAGGTNAEVRALAVHDDGSGARLYVGGAFTSPAPFVARWNGSGWQNVGTGLDGHVYALCEFDDGSGLALYAAGAFTFAGGAPAQRIARWDGASWSAVGSGFNALVTSLAVFDDGDGPRLYAGGDFSASGSTPIRGVARWNGAQWMALGNGIEGSVQALATYDDGTGGGPDLWVGGEFSSAGARESTRIGAWRGCSGVISRICFGDGSTNACPCGNVGLAGRGCDNSVATGGARLNATGTTSPDTIVLAVSAELPNAATLLFQGDGVLTGAPAFGDGLRCAAGSVKRLYVVHASGGAVSVPGPGQDPVSVRSASQGDPLVPGSVRYYQAWYRDSNPAFCAAPVGGAWNLSNGVRIVW